MPILLFSVKYWKILSVLAIIFASTVAFNSWQKDVKQQVRDSTIQQVNQATEEQAVKDGKKIKTVWTGVNNLGIDKRIDGMFEQPTTDGSSQLYSSGQCAPYARSDPTTERNSVSQENSEVGTQGELLDSQLTKKERESIANFSGVLQ